MRFSAAARNLCFTNRHTSPRGGPLTSQALLTETIDETQTRRKDDITLPAPLLTRPTRATFVRKARGLVRAPHSRRPSSTSSSSTAAILVPIAVAEIAPKWSLSPVKLGSRLIAISVGPFATNFLGGINVPSVSVARISSPCARCRPSLLQLRRAGERCKT